MKAYMGFFCADPGRVANDIASVFIALCQAAIDTRQCSSTRPARDTARSTARAKEERFRSARSCWPLQLLPLNVMGHHDRYSLCAEPGCCLPPAWRGDSARRVGFFRLGTPVRHTCVARVRCPLPAPVGSLGHRHLYRPRRRGPRRDVRVGHHVGRGRVDRPVRARS
jgi:hypothetical protein